MTTTGTALAASKPYHHGDLRRALLDAAMAILEREGPAALTLRAVAREAGVSPAAPYHHFHDKNELMQAVSKDGFNRLKQAMAEAAAEVGDGRLNSQLGVAYVEFAHANPALYRVMYDCARSAEMFPESEESEDGGFAQLRRTIAEAAEGRISGIDLELTAIASWSAAHGLAEISTFDKCQPLKDALGGERPFLKAVFEHLGVFSALSREH